MKKISNVVQGCANQTSKGLCLFKYYVKQQKVVIGCTLSIVAMSCQADTDSFGFSADYDEIHANHYRNYTSVNTLTGIEIEAIMTSADELLNPSNYGHRQLNEQWFSQHSTGDFGNRRVGSRASTKLLRIGLSHYWSQLKKTNKTIRALSVLPDLEGQQEVLDFNFDYKIRVNSKGLRFGLKYDF